jgi:phage portal protein BeeE
VYSVDERDGGTDLLGYLYTPGGPASGKKPIGLPADEVAHYIEMPDPTGVFRGQSWITATVQDVDADTNMARHRAKFFHGGTPNLALKMEKSQNPKALEAMKAQFTHRFEGVDNAYKTVFLEGGADLKVIGSQMEQMSFSQVQAMGETRLASAAGIPPVVVGQFAGINAATYSNYSQAMRRFADLSIRPMWRNAAGALATVAPPPAGSELWYDDRNIPFLQQDALDEADILMKNANTLATLHRGGFVMDSALRYVETGDVNALEHSGVPSVQVQALSSTSTEGEDDAE